MGIIIFLILTILTIVGFASDEKTYLNRLATPLSWFVASIILGIILLPILFIYQLIWAIIKFKQEPWKKIIYFIGEVGFVISWILSRIGVGIDILGNVLGELIKKFVSKSDETYFGKVNMTISGSLGHLELDNKLTPFGKQLVNLLNKIFREGGDGHCINSYRYWIDKK